jgi:16S rRNA (cytidine1402-2'-O)-methyltransferase
MSTLYVVATPIGNLADLSPRARDVLGTVTTVIAEDTRVTRKLLSYIKASPQLLSHHLHSDDASVERVLAALDHGNAALVTDAGSPAISDPGGSLVRAAVKRGHDAITIPGPSSVVAALSVSGFEADTFSFGGFVPRNGTEREAALEELRGRGETAVVFEAPHRIYETLSDIARLFGDRQLSISRELSKMFEETFRGTAAEAREYFEEPRGEFVIVIEGAPQASAALTDEYIVESIRTERERGLKGRALVQAVIELTGERKSRVYRLELESRGS